MNPADREAFIASLGFALDDFQESAFDAIDANHHVLVSAPTGQIWIVLPEK